MGWEYLWKCEICRRRFNPGRDGGTCSRCNRSICHEHLGVLNLHDAECGVDGVIVCRECLKPDESLEQVQAQHYRKWFKINAQKLSQ